MGGVDRDRVQGGVGKPGMRLVVLAMVLLASCGTRYERPPVYSTVPAFTLTNQDGAEFHSDQLLKGKVWVADFIFTNCPGPCKRMSSQMKRVQSELREDSDVRFVSFSVDPERDTPAALADYAKRYGADTTRWYFLTGEKETLHSLMRKAFLLGDVDGSMIHSTRFGLVDRAGQVRRYYDTSEDTFFRDLIRDARELVKETP